MVNSLSACVMGLSGLLLVLPPAPAHAGLLDGLFGAKATDAEATKAASRRRSWTLHEFTTIRLMPREPGSSPNQHPSRIDPVALREQLARVRFEAPEGGQPLFGTDELGELGEPLAQAFANAGPDDDVLLLSTSRRGGGVLTPPMGITARLFAQGGALHVIVHDARLDFVNNYIGSRIQPTFEFGSRGGASKVSLQSVSAANRRADWLALPLAAAATPAIAPLAPPRAAPLAATAPAAAVKPAAAVTPAAPAAAATAAATAAPSPSPAGRPRDAAFYDEQGQRLKGLKRLRDDGAITEEEYQQKRKEILSTL